MAILFNQGFYRCSTEPRAVFYLFADLPCGVVWILVFDNPMARLRAVMSKRK